MNWWRALTCLSRGRRSLSVSYPTLLNKVKVTQFVYIADGFVLMMFVLMIFSSYVYLPSYMETLLQVITPTTISTPATENVHVAQRISSIWWDTGKTFLNNTPEMRKIVCMCTPYIPQILMQFRWELEFNEYTLWFYFNLNEICKYFNMPR